MKKSTYSFCIVRPDSRLLNFFKGKINRSHWRKAALMACASASISVAASAQCDSLRNADAANPLQGIINTNKKIAGFAFADIDDDGDQDVYVDFLGDRNERYDDLLLFKNIGTAAHPVYAKDGHTGFGKKKAGGQNGEMQFVDIDGDGDLDYFASDSTRYIYGFSHIHFYKNNGTPTTPKFEETVASFMPPNLGTHHLQAFAFADVDGDGDYDLYAPWSNPYFLFTYYQRVYYNIGTKTNPVYDKGIVYDGNGTMYRTFYDWNKDGLLDFFDVGTTRSYFQNTGTAAKPVWVEKPNKAPKPYNIRPYRMLDQNGDGAVEVFDFDMHYYTLAPVAVIRDSTVTKNGKQYQILYSPDSTAGNSYRWELDGKTVAGAGNYYIVPKQSGTYTLYITNSCGTGVSLDHEFTKTTLQPLTVDSKMASAASVDGIGVKAYPNPFVSTITLSLNGKFSTVKVTDMAGRVLLTQNTSAATIQLGQSLKAGTYMVEVWQAKERVYKTMIVKQ